VGGDVPSCWHRDRRAGRFSALETGSWANLKEPEQRASPIEGRRVRRGDDRGAVGVSGMGERPNGRGRIEKPGAMSREALIFGILIVIVVYLVTNLAYFYALPFGRCSR
jgi:hypothetical protein